MILKKHLHFVGNPEKKEISFHYIEGMNEDIIIDVKDYEKIWNYLLLLSNSNSLQEIESWKKEYEIEHTEFEDINNFLIENGMVYESISYNENIRAVNFFNNYINVRDNGEVIKRVEDKRALIIGIGTVGTALISGLQQIGMKKFVLIDNDIIDSRNIFHQRNFYISDVGKSKCKIATERMRAVDPTCEVGTYEEFIDCIDIVKKIVLENDIDVVFCCFDKHTSAFLNELYEFLDSRNIPVYLSGYIMSMIKAYKLEDEIIKEEIEFEKTHQDVITDNSGIGILGDIAALLMIRLWLQLIDSKFDMNVTNLEYDFLQPTTNRKVYLQELENFAYDGLRNGYQENNIIFPYVLMKYVRYLQGDYQEMNQIDSFCKKNQIEFIEESENQIEEYLEYINSLQIVYEGKSISILDFSEIVLREDVGEEYFDDYILQQEKIVDSAIKYIKQKKEKYYAYYINDWKRKEELNKTLLLLAKKIAKNVYTEEMDFLKYKPFKKNGYNLSEREEISIVKNIDACNLYTDYRGFIDYCLEHNFLHIKDRGNNSVCIMNPRYGTSDIIVSKNHNWQDVFSIAHEIGHAYYNSFMPKGVAEMDELTSEVFSMLTEYRVIKSLFDDNKICLFGKAIKDRIQSVMIGMFSLDLYEKGILDLECITYEEIMRVRKKINRQIFEDITLKNENYSKYNMFMNPEMVIGKREVYLYPEAMLIGYDLGIRIEKNQELELQLTNFLKNYGNQKNIYDFYSELGEEKINYFQMANQIWQLWLKIDDLLKEREK